MSKVNNYKNDQNCIICFRENFNGIILQVHVVWLLQQVLRQMHVIIPQKHNLKIRLTLSFSVVLIKYYVSLFLTLYYYILYYCYDWNNNKSTHKCVERFQKSIYIYIYYLKPSRTENRRQNRTVTQHNSNLKTWTSK